MNPSSAEAVAMLNEVHNMLKEQPDVDIISCPTWTPRLVYLRGIGPEVARMVDMILWRWTYIIEVRY